MKTKIALTAFWLIATLIVAFSHKETRFVYDNFFSNLEYLAILSCKISLIACFWVFVLTDSDMIFGYIRQYLNGLAESYYMQDLNINDERLEQTNIILKPIITCEICVGANLGFWIYASIQKSTFVILDLFFILSMTTIITLLSRKLWQRN